MVGPLRERLAAAKAAGGGPADEERVRGGGGGGHASGSGGRRLLRCGMEMRRGRGGCVQARVRARGPIAGILGWKGRAQNFRETLQPPTSNCRPQAAALAAELASVEASVEESSRQVTTLRARLEDLYAKVGGQRWLGFRGWLA